MKLASNSALFSSYFGQGQFDDVVRKAAPASSAPKRREELDDSKSQKGLAEIYEVGRTSPFSL